MTLKELVYPTKNKIIASVVLSILWLALIFSFSSSITNYVLGEKGLGDAVLALIINFFLMTVFFYPLSCAAEFVYHRTAKKTKSDHVTTLAVALFIVVLNPVSFSIMSFSSQVIVRDYMTKPCGAEVLSFSDMNTALYSGLSDRDVIIEAGGQKIDTIESLRNALAGRKIGENITVKTLRGNSTLAMIDHPEKHIPVIGIQAGQKYCSKYF